MLPLAHRIITRTMYNVPKSAIASQAIDLRSDTVTRPSASMKQAMVNAEVGDDVFKEDPTVNELEQQCARLLGKEASLFVPSGTMGNLIAMMVHCNERGDFVITGDKQHTVRWEQGNYAQFGGIASHVLANQPDGSLAIDQIQNALITGYPDPHCGRTRLVTLENTHNGCGGIPLTLDYLEELSEFAKEHNLKVHVDGARLYNAAVALNVVPERLTRGIDSVSMCFSKGLGCPVGSILAGSQEFITRATRVRKALGGGMRQAGVLAAAALVALDEAPQKIARDHQIAKEIAEGLSQIKGLSVELPPTNILLVKTGTLAAEDVRQKLLNATPQPIKVLAVGANSLRLVTHCDVPSGGVQNVIAGFRDVFC